MPATSAAMGHQTMVALAKQTTFGTAVTRTLALRVAECGLKVAQQVAQKSVLGHSSKHITVNGKRSVEGNLKLMLPGEGTQVQNLLEAAFGSHSVAAGVALDAAAGYKYVHTYALLDTLPEAGLSLEVDADYTASGVALLFDSCKVNKLTLTQAMDEALMADFSFLGKDGIAITPTGSLSAQSLANHFDFDDLVVTVAGTAVDVEALEISIENNLDADSYKMGSLTRKNIKRKDTRTVSGKIDCEMDAATLHTLFDGLTEFALVATWTGPSIGLISAAAVPRTFVLSAPRCVFQQGFDGVKDAGRIKLSLPFICAPTINTDVSELVCTFTNAEA